MLLRLIIMSSALSVLPACGGGPRTTKPKQAKKVPVPSAAERIATAYSGPKIRVAVGDFKDYEQAKEYFKSMGWAKLGPGISGQIVTALVKTGRVAVLERQEIGKVVGNLALESESKLSKYFNKKTTAKTGKLLGAQAVLVGEITQFEPNISGGKAGLDIPGLGSLTYHTDKAIVGMDVRLVHQETGKVLAAGNGSATIDSSKFGAEGEYKGVKVGGGAWKRTPLGNATRKAATRAIEKLVSALKEIPWEGKVIKVSEPNRIFIEAGHDLNLKKGDTFRVIHRGDAIKGPGGNIMGYDETEGGTVSLSIVQSKMSIGTVKGKLPKVGDVVRLMAK